MTRLACAPERAPDESAVADHATADAGRHRQVDEVRNAPARPERGFGQRRRVRVVLDSHLDAQRLFERRSDGNIVPVRQIGRIEQHAAHRIGRTGNGNSDALERVGADVTSDPPDARLPEQCPRVAGKDVQVDAPIAGELHRTPAGDDRRPLAIAHREYELRPTDIDAQKCHHPPSFRVCLDLSRSLNGFIPTGGEPDHNRTEELRRARRRE